MKRSSDAAREIHHRVKNNLQIIASILRLQIRRESSLDAQLALGGAVNRILGMVEVHDLLAHADAQTIHLTEMLRRLLALHTQTLLAPGQTIRSSVQGRAISIDADRGLVLALAANELIVNAFKHAFSGRKEGTLLVTVEQSSSALTITITDNGQGLPSDFSITGSANLGLRLVRSIVEEDLKGSFALTPAEPGVRASLLVPQATT